MLGPAWAPLASGVGQGPGDPSEGWEVGGAAGSVPKCCCFRDPLKPIPGAGQQGSDRKYASGTVAWHPGSPTFLGRAHRDSPLAGLQPRPDSAHSHPRTSPRELDRGGHRSGWRRRRKAGRRDRIGAGRAVTAERRPHWRDGVGGGARCQKSSPASRRNSRPMNPTLVHGSGCPEPTGCGRLVFLLPQTHCAMGGFPHRWVNAHMSVHSIR
jgi:hypothetical protein